MTSLEDELSRVLSDAAERAPRAPSGLAATVETRHRRRRGRTVALLAAASVVVLVGGAGVVVNAMRAPAAPQPATGPTGKPAADAIPPPVEKVWPQAVHKIPAELPDGRAYHPQLLLDQRTLLVMTGAGDGTRQFLYSYDLAGGKPKRLAEIPPTKGSAIFAEGVAAGGGNIVWWASYKGAGKDRVARIWTVPAGGGTPRQVTDVPLGNVMKEGHIADLTVVGKDVIFAYEKGGVHRAPLAGGKARPVQGGEKQRILQWPWVGAHPGNDDFVELVNLETGERRDAVVAADEEIACDVNRCTGEQVQIKKVKCEVKACKGEMLEQRRTLRSFVRNRDGSGEKPLTFWMPYAQLERFYQRHLFTAGDEPIVSLYDMKTGKSADLGIRQDAQRRMSSPDGRRDRLMTYQVGDEVYVLDLSTIK